MRPVTLAVLAVVVAGLGLFIWFVEGDLPSTDERREQATLALPIGGGEVEALVVERASDRARLEKAPGGNADEAGEWWLVEPREARAETDLIEGLISDLAALEKLRQLDDVEPGDVGLDDPRLRLTVESDGRDWVLEVGSSVPATDNVVVSVHGRGTFVVVGDFLGDLDRAPGEWRSRQLVPVMEREIESLGISMAEGSIDLERRHGRFHLEAPLNDEADQQATDELLQAVVELEVRRFIDGTELEVDPGLERPVARIEVGVAGRDEPLVIELGSLVDGPGIFYGVSQAQLFTVETDLPELLERPVSAWRSLDWSSFDAFEIDAANVALREEAFELVRENGEWHRDGVALSYATARGLLDAVTALRGERLIESPGRQQAGAEPSLTIELTAGERSETLSLWRHVDGAATASRSGRSVELEIAPESAATLFEAVETVRDESGEAADDGAAVAFAAGD